MFVIRTISFLAIVASLITSSSAAPVHEERDAAAGLDAYDYIVVGSGAGGGPLAARLAIKGQKVLLIEAGDDQGDALQQSIPAFYPAASEFAPMTWDFFVRHYSDDAREAQNIKATYATPSGETYIGLNPPEGSTLKGIWYPRTGTLGGCAAHNAMVTVYPHERDWSLIQSLTGDSSWAPENMRQYFERLERNEYLTDFTQNPGHGVDGWLGTDEASLDLIAADSQSLALVAATNALKGSQPELNITNAEQLATIFPRDMNTAFPDRDTTEGLFRVPMHVSEGRRSSPRDFLIATANAVNADGSKKYQLEIRTQTFVTKIRFSEEEGAEPKAVGVDFLSGQSLYTADPRNAGAAGTAGSVNAAREVIISAGTFNTPQLLKLSGIGPKAELEKFDIPIVVDLPGVGTNLQDHYEISTVHKFNTSFELLEGCTFGATADDPCLNKYFTNANAADKGPYATNLLPSSVLLKSSVAGKELDTFVFGGPVMFRGYFQGYTNAAIADTQHWSWVTLKAHERNVAGSVTLKSANPLDTPAVNFNYFDAGTTAGGADALDIKPMVEGINWSRKVLSEVSGQFSFIEEQPGPEVTTTEEIEDFIKNQSWGHHASCTARIGSDSDPLAVLDSHFRVRGVSGLRVVDASSFPQIPGFFPVTAVFMIGEKAADVIIADNA